MQLLLGILFSSKGLLLLASVGAAIYFVNKSPLTNKALVPVALGLFVLGLVFIWALTAAVKLALFIGGLLLLLVCTGAIIWILRLLKKKGGIVQKNK